MKTQVLTNINRLEAGEWRKTDLIIEDGLIADFDASGKRGAEAMDGKGAYLFAGGVDLHVHFNEPGRLEWEGFATGSAAAAAGGITYVADMPLNSIPATTSVDAFMAKRKAASGQSRVDFGLWGGVVPGNAEELPALAEAGVMGFKAFISPSGVPEFAHSDATTLRKAMRAIAPTGLRLALHAEDPAVLESAAAALSSRKTSADWLASRPVAAEISAVQIAIELSAETGCPITIVHVTSPEVLAVIHEAQGAGADIICETCPHYLLLSCDEVDAIGPNAKCAPPLRPPETVAAMLDMLAGGGIDTIGSDHSPSPPELKAGKTFYDAWGGIAGIQHGLPFLIDLFGLEDAERLQVLQDRFATVPAGLIGRPEKGRLDIGAEASFFIVDALPEQLSVDAESLLQSHKTSPYLGFDMELTIRSTWLRGQKIIEFGKPTAEPSGQFVPGCAAGKC